MSDTSSSWINGWNYTRPWQYFTSRETITRLTRHDPAIFPTRLSTDLLFLVLGFNAIGFIGNLEYDQDVYISDDKESVWKNAMWG